MFDTIYRQSLLEGKEGAIELVKRVRGILEAEKNKYVDEAMQKAILEELSCSRLGRAVREASKANILVEDRERVWDLFTKLRSFGFAEGTHLVLEKANFELLTDLVFLGYLIESKGAMKIMLHVKQMPWFVSVVTMNDMTRPIQGSKGTIYDGIDPADDKEVRQAGKYW